MNSNVSNSFHHMRSFAKIFVRPDSVKCPSGYRTRHFSEIRPDTPTHCCQVILTIVQWQFRLFDRFEMRLVVIMLAVVVHRLCGFRTFWI